MNKCKRFTKMISNYIEGELLQDDEKQFEDHINKCPNCGDIVTKTKKLRNNLYNLNLIQTSQDFDTVLHTRIRIESGIGRRRLHEIVWNWPTKIPVYGMSLALIIIAFMLVIEQINKPNRSLRPEPYVNTKWYGGKPGHNTDQIILDENEKYIYVIERTSPEKILDNNNGLSSPDESNSLNSTKNDSAGTSNERITSVNHIIY